MKKQTMILFLKQFIKDFLFCLNHKITLEINYNHTVQQMIDECNFNRVEIGKSRYILGEEFLGKEVVIEGKLFTFHDYYSATKAVKKMKRKGYEPANLYELLAFTKAKPEFYKKYVVAAIGDYVEKPLYDFWAPIVLGNDSIKALRSDRWCSGYLEGNGIACLGVKR